MDETTFDRKKLQQESQADFLAFNLLEATIESLSDAKPEVFENIGPTIVRKLPGSLNRQFPIPRG